MYILKVLWNLKIKIKYCDLDVNHRLPKHEPVQAMFIVICVKIYLSRSKDERARTMTKVFFFFFVFFCLFFFIPATVALTLAP